MTKDPAKVAELVNAMIGHNLITKQTPKEGIPVSKVTFKMLEALLNSSGEQLITPFWNPLESGVCFYSINGISLIWI